MHMHVDKRSLTPTHTRAHARTQTSTYAHTCTFTQKKHTYIHAHTHAHADAHTLTHSHTHTHTHSLSLSCIARVQLKGRQCDMTLASGCTSRILFCRCGPKRELGREHHASHITPASFPPSQATLTSLHHSSLLVFACTFAPVDLHCRLCPPMFHTLSRRCWTQTTQAPSSTWKTWLCGAHTTAMFTRLSMSSASTSSSAASRSAWRMHSCCSVVSNRLKGQHNRLGMHSHTHTCTHSLTLTSPDLTL